MRAWRRLVPLVSLGLVVAGCSRAVSPVERVEWPVMGTVAAVQCRGGGTAPAALASSVRRTFEAVQSVLNAHNPTSEISRLAALPAAELLARCTPAMRPCYEAALRLAQQSGNAFDPRWRGAGTLDLGAIAKGFAVDLAVHDVMTAGADLLVDLGGNLKSAQGCWRTGVQSPTGAGLSARVELRPGEALATSAEYFRGKHICDGRTHSPVSNDVASVTVLHPSSAMLADGLSTTLFVLGTADGAEFLSRHYPDAAALWELKGGGTFARDPHNRFALCR